MTDLDRAIEDVTGIHIEPENAYEEMNEKERKRFCIQWRRMQQLFKGIV